MDHVRARLLVEEGGDLQGPAGRSQLHEVVPRPEPLRPHSPVWSLDGKRIAWAQWNIEDEGPTQVWTASAEGSDRRMVAELDQIYTISWSPDGETLAASPGRAGAVYLIDIDSGNAEILVEGASGAEWSADGSHLYYWRKIGDPGNGPMSWSGATCAPVNGSRLKGRDTPGISTGASTWSPCRARFCARDDELAPCDVANAGTLEPPQVAARTRSAAIPSRRCPVASGARRKDTVGV
ncbi:MAG: hypothetical protein GEU68_07330 [Actinobacteria bacterium]|nr:hypothetical protein [Actinomycetota bacterium]